VLNKAKMQSARTPWTRTSIGRTRTEIVRDADGIAGGLSDAGRHVAVTTGTPLASSEFLLVAACCRCGCGGAPAPPGRPSGTASTCLVELPQNGGGASGLTTGRQ
jgi:hypothetical protein